MAHAGIVDGLYAITDDYTGTTVELARRVEQAIDGGAQLVQYRDKQTGAAQRHARAAALLAVCRRHGIALIVNDDVELAASIDANGVHLGASDATITAARKRLGARAIIGASCYNRPELARAAVAAGADYVAFGRFFASYSNPGLLTHARHELPVPIVAIGGITPANGADLLRAGANLLAVIHGVFGQPDIQAAARAYTRLFEPLNREI